MTQLILDTYRSCYPQDGSTETRWDSVSTERAYKQAQAKLVGNNHSFRSLGKLAFAVRGGYGRQHRSPGCGSSYAVGGCRLMASFISFCVPTNSWYVAYSCDSSGTIHRWNAEGVMMSQGQI